MASINGEDQTEKSLSVCLFCGGAVGPTGHPCGDRPSLDVGRCEGCGLVQVMDFSHVNEGYYAADEYFPAEAEPMYAREAHWNVKRVERCLALLPNPASRKLLDFGCGIGGFLKRARPYFERVIGFDLSKRVVEEHCAEGFPCVGDLVDVPLDTDTVVLFHVLEHLPRPWNLLAEIVDRFPSVDRIVVEVPHGEEALVTWFNSAQYRLNQHNSEHVYYFSDATLRAVLERAGLQVLVASQLQRYALGNTFGWLLDGRGGGQNRWTVFK